MVQENWQWSTEAFRDDAFEREPLKLGNSERRVHDGKSLDSARLQAIEDTMNDKKYRDMSEDIARQLLVPNLPVISIKKLKASVKEALTENQESLFEVDSQDGKSIKFKKVDPEEFKELVYAQISKLQRAVYRDNKIELYNRDGIGLNFAYEEGCHENLQKGDDAFYYAIFTQQTIRDDEEQKRRVRSVENSDKGSSLGKDDEPDQAKSEDQDKEDSDLFKQMPLSCSSYSGTRYLP